MDINGAVNKSSESLKSLYKEFVDLLGKQQPEFADDYEKFYRPFEKEGFRVLSFHFSEPGYLSNHPRFQNAVKRKIFLDEGPI